MLLFSRSFFFMAFILSIACVSANGGQLPEKKEVPVDNMVTMVDLGAKSCIPCKMMAPVLKELEEEYNGRAAIIFIDVWEQKEKAGEFGISSIPTQIFYNKSGQEVWRHSGFIDKKSISEKLDALLK